MEPAEKNPNSTLNNLLEQLGLYQTGKTKAIAAFTPHRPKLFANAPAFRDLAKDVVYFIQRSVISPRLESWLKPSNSRRT
jgi:tripartite-type tricarboxylate transporter receptor subunit TctC